MRIIKLSPNDPDMMTREKVTTFFREKLKRRTPSGQFFLTQGRIAEKGITPGERLLFTYNGECVYQARAASGRTKTEGSESSQYPFYFCVDEQSIVDAVGSLQDFENGLKQRGLLDKNLVRSQGWPKIDDTNARVGPEIDRLLGKV